MADRNKLLAQELAAQQIQALHDRQRDLTGVAPSVAEDVSRHTGGLLDPAYDSQRNAILPRHTSEGWIAPQLLASVLRAIDTPGYGAEGGNVTPEDAANFAMNFTGGGAAAGKVAGPEGRIAGMGASSELPAEEAASQGFAGTGSGRTTIRGAQRKAFPGIYQDPKALAQTAESMVAPESPLLGQLFGVTREDLAKIGNTPGTAPGGIPNLPKTRPRGAKAAGPVMYPANTRRLVDALQATEEHAPNLRTGMTGWYAMDPAYQRLVDLVGPEEAEKRYTRFNNLTGMSSPMSDVVTELMRGTAANKLANEGRFGEFRKYGGLPADKRLAMGLPPDMTTFPGHPAHSTAQAPAMEDFLATGKAQMDSPKVPLYIQASNATELGRQTDIPVGDAHWSRAVGLADTRNPVKVKGKMRVPGSSVSTPELSTLAPWWRDEVAAPAGFEAVPGQATAWGLFAPQTGVETAIGAPKLEILSDLIGRTAQRLNIPVERARDMVLLGEAQAGKIDPELLAIMGGGAAAAAVGGAASMGADGMRKKMHGPNVPPDFVGPLQEP